MPSAPAASEALPAAPGGAAKVPLLDKVGYGVGNVAYSLPYQLSASLLMLFATEILGIPPAIAGTIGALSIVWDAFTDPIVGSLSENTESRRFGRRHGYILWGGLAIAVSTYALWTISPHASLAARLGLFV